MGFCYKIITETPRRSGHVSPRKHSPARRPGHVSPRKHSPARRPGHVSPRKHSPARRPGHVSPRKHSPARRPADSCIPVAQSVAEELEAIPEREWRLLAALARKKEEELERACLAAHCRTLWDRERRHRDLVAAQAREQYKQYLEQKRLQEDSWLLYKRLQLAAEQTTRRAQLAADLRHKEACTRDRLATRDDQKATELVQRALQDEARMLLAAERRTLHSETERSRRHLQLQHALQRATDAHRKRDDLLKHSSKRLAISNALSSWESCVVRHETSVAQEARRAQHAASAARTERRSEALAAQRSRRETRARRLAALTASIRDELRATHYTP